MRRVVLLLISCAALASCGGSGSGSVSSGSTGGSPTPTPGPTTLNTGELKPTPDATYLSSTLQLTTTGGVSETNGIITGGTTSGRTTTLDTPAFTGSYSASSGYRLADAANLATFGPAQLATDTTTPNGNGIVLFTKVAGSVEDYLALYQNTTYSSSSKGAGYTPASYAGVGGWQHTLVGGSSRDTRLDYFSFGPATPIGAMPKSGIVKFALRSFGNYATDTDLWFLTSQSGVVLTVDFGAGTVSGTLTLAGQNFYKSVVGGIGSIPLKGSISGNSVTASAFASLETASGVPAQFHLTFVGPNANELILTYAASDSSHAAVGAGVGIVDPYIQ